MGHRTTAIIIVLASLALGIASGFVLPPNVSVAFALLAGAVGGGIAAKMWHRA